MIAKYIIQTIIFSLIGLCVVGQLYLPIPVLTSIGKELNLDSAKASWLISIFGYSYACGFLVFGPLSDRFGKKIILLIGMFLLSLLTILLISSNKNIMLIRGLQGFFAASYPPLILAYIGNNFPKNIRGIAISSMSFAFLSAVIISQLFITNLVGSSFIRAEQVLLAFYLLAILAIFLTIQSEKNVVNTNLFQNFYNIPKVLFNRDLVHYFIYTFSVLFIFVSFYLLLSSANSPFINKLFSLRLFGFPFFLFTFAVPIMLKKMTTTSILRLAFFLQLVALLLAGLAFKMISFPILILSNLIITLSTALLVPSLIGVIGQKAMIETRGTAISLYTFVLFCGASSAPIIVNYLSHQLTIGILLMSLSVFPFFLIISSKKEGIL